MAPPVLANFALQDMNRLPSLDGVRGIAILTVLGSHLSHSEGFPIEWEPAWGYVFNGSVGVLVFFVLSGFLITHLLLREEASTGAISIRTFYVRRALRILPVYLAFLIVLAVIAKFTAIDIPASGWVSSLTFTKNFWGGQWIDGHLWSLAVEEQFYLVWPVVFKFMSKRGRMLFAITLICSAPVFRVMLYSSRSNGLYDFSFFANMDTLMLGAFGAMVMNEDISRLRQIADRFIYPARVFLILAIYGVWMMQKHHMFGIFTVPFGTTFQSMAVLLLIVSSVLTNRGWMYKFLNLRLISSIGLISYGAYIWQQPLMMTGSAYGFSGFPAILWFPWVVGTALFVAWISYQLLEKPFFRLRERFR